MRLVREADLYIISKQWTVNIMPVVNHYAYQPWVGWFPPEGRYRQRLVWIDQGIKKAMGQ